MARWSEVSALDGSVRDTVKTGPQRQRRLPWPSAVALIAALSVVMWGLIWLCLKFLLQA